MFYIQTIYIYIYTKHIQYNNKLSDNEIKYCNAAIERNIKGKPKAQHVSCSLFKYRIE